MTQDRLIKAVQLIQLTSERISRDSLEAELLIRRLVNQELIDTQGNLFADAVVDPETDMIGGTTIKKTDFLMWIQAIRMAAEYNATTTLYEGGPTILQIMERLVP